MVLSETEKLLSITAEHEGLTKSLGRTKSIHMSLNCQNAGYPIWQSIFVSLSSGQSWVNLIHECN